MSTSTSSNVEKENKPLNKKGSVGSDFLTPEQARRGFRGFFQKRSTGGATSDGDQGDISAPPSPSTQMDAVGSDLAEIVEEAATDPNVHVFDYVVLGGGTAAGFIASAFAANGVTNHNLAIISREAFPPYERRGLSKGYLFKETHINDMLVQTYNTRTTAAQTDSWYIDHRIDLILSSVATECDLEHRTVRCDTGKTYIARKALVLATGSRPNLLPHFNEAADGSLSGATDLKHVFYVQMKTDADKIVTHVNTFKHKTLKCVVVGSGYLGMEVAASISQMGLQTTMVARQGRLNPSMFSSRLSKHYEKVFADKGVEIILANKTTKLVGENGVFKYAILANGDKLYADLAVMAIGNTPNTELFKGQCVMRNGSIRVDGALETSTPDVYAVGDICQLPLGMYGNSVSGGSPLMHGDHARRSGSHVVKSILKRKAPHKRMYEYCPYLYSSFFHCSWRFWGDTVGEEFILGRMEDNSFMVVWLWENRLQGVFVESIPRYWALMMEAAARTQSPVFESQLTQCKTVREAVEQIAAGVDLSMLNSGIEAEDMFHE